MSRGATPILVAFLLACGVAGASYTNFESSHVHPIDLTPSGARLLAVNTPDAMLEVFSVQTDGSLLSESSIPVGLEPVTVVALDDQVAWVVNNLSDTVSIVDLDQAAVTQTIFVGNEPTDVVFANGRAFVTASEEDSIKVFDLASLDSVPIDVDLAGRDIRALAVYSDDDETLVYAVPLRSGNRTTIVNANIAHFNDDGADPIRLGALGMRDLTCSPSAPAYPPLPGGVTRNPALTDPADGLPKVGLIVKWDESDSAWEDDAGTSWNDCISYRLFDHDLFVVDATTLAVSTVDHLGTSLFDVSVHPDGRVFVSNTDARNHVRLEPRLTGHVVDNRLSVVDPSAGHAVTTIDLNTHISRASDPATNLAERQASISQPGMLVWQADGSVGYLTGFGSRKVFRVDGTCSTGSCIFGASRSAPDVAQVGEGPSGVALLESKNRLYVLGRISHTLSIVDTTSLAELERVALHDPSSTQTRDGRRFLYDAVDGSGHGDAACSSCHLSGDLDGVAWDLGDPGGSMVPYSKAMDNVRFITLGGLPCDTTNPNCTVHQGFDPQKGPMATQTLRGMLEPLHWRGDRATMNDFNAAFVGLMGTADIGPINGQPAGLSATDMEAFRQFALEMRFPPNPHRQVDDTLPCPVRGVDPGCETQPHGSLFPGNPAEGELMFNTAATDGGGPCVACHTHPFGAAGGKLGGVTPTEPTSMDASALFNGVGDQSLHNDLEVPHLRNMYEKFGPVLAAPADASMPETINGFGFGHDGSVPDLFRFFSIDVFSLSAAAQAQQVRDIATFMFFFPTGTKPAVGRSLTLPQGTPPTGSAADESLLTTLISLGDLSDSGRHCELVASAPMGESVRRFHLDGGVWVGDLAAEPPKTSTALREAAEGAISFVCTPLGSGPRLGGDRDEDATVDGDDCASADPGSWLDPPAVEGLELGGETPTLLTWNEQATLTGPGVRYDLAGGLLSDLHASDLAAATACIAADLESPQHTELRTDPAPGDGYYYLSRGRNTCSVGGFGPNRGTTDGLSCP